MSWTMILGLILLLMALAGVFILCFIVDWKGTLFALAIVAMMFLGAFLLRGGL